MTTLPNHLKILRRLQPDAAFALRSRTAILKHPQQSFYRSFFNSQIKQSGVLIIALGMATFLLFVIGNISRLHLNGFSPQLLTSLDKTNLELEKKSLQFDLHLSEARYYKETANQITMTLKTVFDSETAQLDIETIKRQAQNLDSLLEEL